MWKIILISQYFGIRLRKMFSNGCFGIYLSKSFLTFLELFEHGDYELTIDSESE